LGELYNCFAAKARTFLFVAVELFHGGGGDVLKFVFWAVLQKYISFDSEGFVKESSKGLA
jgi:hypothetical protein